MIIFRIGWILDRCIRSSLNQMLHSSQLEVPSSIDFFLPLCLKKSIAFYRRWIFHLTSSSTFGCLSCFEEKNVDHTLFLYRVFLRKRCDLFYYKSDHCLVLSLSQAVTLRFEYCLNNSTLFSICQSGYMDITKLLLEFVEIDTWIYQDYIWISLIF